MGCGTSKGAASSPAGEGGNGGGDTAAGAAAGGAKADADNQQLMTHYTLGEALGQGAFGVVYACAKKGTKDFNLAVKMVDKVETPVAEIKKEAEMLKTLECD